MFCIGDTNGYFKHLNPKWSELLGYGLDELYSRPYTDFLHPEDVQSSIEEASKLASGGHETVGFKNRYITKSGEVVWLQWTTRIVDGLLVANVVDNTKLENALAEIEEQKALLDGVVQNSPGMAFQVSVDEQMNVNNLFISQQCNQIFGINVDEYLSRQPSLFDLADRKGAERLRKAIIQSRATMSACEWRGDITNYNGEQKSIFLKSSPRLIETGEILWNGVLIDITEMVQLENELEVEKRKLFHASKLASIGELSAGIGHEINNPLAVAKGNIENLKKQLANKSIGCSEAIGNIEKALIRIEKTVAALRVYSGENLNRADQVIDLNEVLEKSLKLLTDIYLLDGICISSQLKANRSKILANEGKIERIIVSLLSNARDFVVNQDYGEIIVSTRVDEDQIIFEVRDNGAGIPTGKLDRVFDFSYTTKSGEQSVGLGLPLVRELVAQLGGQIGVRSKENEGTSFWVSFPLYTDLRKPISSVQMPLQEKGNLDGRILVVDDEEGILEILEDNLKDLGLSPTLTTDVEEALNLIAAHEYDFVLTDFKMPKLNGGEFTREAKTRAKGKPKYILMTGGIDGRPGSAMHSEILSLFDEVVTKPFTNDDLYAAFTV